MTQSPSPQTPTSLSSSRLVKLLSHLAVSDVPQSKVNFGERLGNLIDFSDSIILSGAYNELESVVFEKRSQDSNETLEAFLKVRGDLVEAIIKSTTPNNHSNRLRLPKISNQDPQKPLLDFETYFRFYASHQRNIDSKISHLRFQIRDDIACHSAELAQLARLDEALDNTLLAHNRKFFALIPRLIRNRFNHLLKEHRDNLPDPALDTPEQWIATGGWLAQFCMDLQALLLAELELRLQPILGLVEAMNAMDPTSSNLKKEVTHTDD